GASHRRANPRTDAGGGRAYGTSFGPCRCGAELNTWIAPTSKWIAMSDVKKGAEIDFRAVLADLWRARRRRENRDLAHRRAMIRSSRCANEEAFGAIEGK